MIMKFDIVKTVIAIAVSALAAYGMYVINTCEHTWLLPSVAFVEMSLIFISAIAINVPGVRTMVNARIVSWLFLFAVVVMNICFAANACTVPTFIISNGCLVLFFLLIVYSILKAQQRSNL